MDFGRVPEAALSGIDFRLPADPADNRQVLKGKPCDEPRIYLGGTRWVNKEWIGKLYPKTTRETNLLNEYARHFNTIELNATHYKLYRPEDIHKWVAKVEGNDFLFCPKVYQGISHVGSLSDKQLLTDAFLQEIVAFGDLLGPVFLQVSDRFGPSRREELFAYLATLPTDVTFFLEVRHPDWFLPPHSTALFDELRNLRIGAVITDTAGRRDCCHMHLTLPQAMVRYVGNSLHASDPARINDWIERIRYWLDKGLERLFFFMHMHDDALVPELTAYLAERLNKAGGFRLKVPQLISPPPELF